MKLSIHSTSTELYSTRRLLEAGRSMGHDTTMLNPFGLSAKASGTGLEFRSGSKALATPDVIIPRVGSILTDWNLLMVEALIAQGARSPVSAEALALAADKARCSFQLSRCRLPVVPTWVLREDQDVHAILDSIGANDLVLKLPHGTHGRNVVGVRGREQAVIQLQRWFSEGHAALVQPWVKLTPCRDLRVFIVKSRAIAACWRIAKDGEFRSNVHQGGRAVAAELDHATRALAEAAAEAIGLRCGGVDLIEAPQFTGEHGGQFAVLEVNGCPGLESIESTSKLDLATALIDAAIDG